MKYYCPYCGIEIKKKQKSCKHCKYQFRTNTQEDDKKSEAKWNDVRQHYEDLAEKNNEHGLYINIVLCVLIILMLIFIIIMMFSMLPNALAAKRHCV